MNFSRVWKIFCRNTPALIGLVVFLLFCLLALSAPILSPDPTINASRQVSEAIRVPPGTEGKFLRLTNVQAVENSLPKRVFLGEELSDKWLLLDSHAPIIISTDTLQAQLITGDSRNFLIPILLYDPDESEPFNQFCLEHFSKPYYLNKSKCIWQEEGKFRSATLNDMVTTVNSENVVSFTWWMGSDGYGRDVLSRMLKGSRVSIGVGLAALLLSLIVGVPLGIVAGYFGGITDRFIQGFISIIWSLPSLLLAMVLSFVLGKGFWQVFLAVGLTLWVDVARMVRGSVLSIKESSFIEAAKALGFSTPRILWVHILPNLAGPVILVSTSCFATAILIESGLSFLGIGIQAPMPSWGNMLQEGYTQIVLSGGQWLAIFPGLAIICIVVSLNLIGYGLRDALDPKEKE
jgi:ABC-type dipeptide/oligopeptide/nickel transport system permease subunit